MKDEVFELLRKNLIDVALDSHDWERLKRLTSDDARDQVISPFYDNSFDFLCYDEHFFERRILGNERAASLNYRFHDFVANHVCIGEIHIPLNTCAGFYFQYGLKNKRNIEHQLVEPEWFSSLVNRVRILWSYKE